MLRLVHAQTLATVAQIKFKKNKFYLHFRWLKQWDIKLASEGEMRRTIDDNLDLAIEAENVPLSFPNAGDGGEVRLAPLVQILHLKEAIFSLLNKHQR